MHYSFAILPSAVYGMLRDRVPYVGAGHGALWGLGLFVVQDELLNTVSGLGADPRDYPWQDHARGLVAHVVYGVVADLAFSALRGRLH